MNTLQANLNPLDNILDVSGNTLLVSGSVRASSYSFTTPKTRYLSLSSEAFQPSYSGITGWVNNGGIGGAWVWACSAPCNSGSVTPLISPLKLPHGAVIRSWTVYYVDQSSLQCALGIQIFADEVYGGVSSFTSSGNSTAARSSVQTIAHTVNNIGQGYYISCYATPGPDWDATGIGFTQTKIRMQGHLITYEISEAD